MNRFLTLLVSVLLTACTVDDTPSSQAPHPIHRLAARSAYTTIAISGFVATPTLTSVTPTNGAAGHYTYKIVGVAADGTTTPASAGVAITNGPTTLGVNGDALINSYNTLLWTEPANAVTIRFYRTAGGATQGLIGSAAVGPSDAGTQSFIDAGAVGDGSTAPTVNTTGVGPSVGVADLSDPTIQFAGTFTATMQVQGKIDPLTSWVNIGSPVTSAGILDITATAKALSQLRIQMTAYTSGTPTAAVAGH